MDGRPVILVVDDSAMSRDALRGFFTEAGCRVVCAESGDGAWATLTAGTAVDLVVLDWHMPQGMNGPALNRKILSDDRFKSIPVVAFTSRWGGTQETPESREWVASFMGEEAASLSLRDRGPVAKADGISDVRRIPPELVVSVAQRLRQAGKNVPRGLEDAAADLRQQGIVA